MTRARGGVALVGRLAVVAALVVASASMTRSANAAGLIVKCVGEQSTYTGHIVATMQWPALLQTMLPAGSVVTNDGDNGASVLSPAAGGVHPYTASTKFADSKTPPMDYVVIGPWGMHDQIAIMAGDMPANFQADYDALVSVYLGLTPKPKVILSTAWLKPTNAGGAATYQNDAATLALIGNTINPAVKAVAAKYSLPVLDLATLITTTTYVTNDGGWTSPAGHTKMASLVYDEIIGGDAGPGGGSGMSSGASSGTATSGTATSGTATTGTSTTGTSTSGTATSGTSTSGTATSGTATSGTATSGTSAAGSTSSGTATSGMGGAGSTASGVGTSGTSVGGSGTTSASGTTMAGSGTNGTTAGSTTPMGTPNNSSGCAMVTASASGRAAGLLSLFGLALFAARKRDRRRR